MSEVKRVLVTGSDEQLFRFFLGVDDNAPVNAIERRAQTVFCTATEEAIPAVMQWAEAAGVSLQGVVLIRDARAPGGSREEYVTMYQPVGGRLWAKPGKEDASDRVQARSDKPAR